MFQTNLSCLPEPLAQHLLEELPLPIAIVDPTGAIKFLNNCFNNTFTDDYIHSVSFKQIWQNSLAKQDIAPFTLPASDADSIFYARSLVLGKDTVLIFEKSVTTAQTDNVNELQQRIIELEKANAVDRLTGAWNRIHFEKSIKIEVNRSIRYRQALSLLFLDIDHFQKINDQHSPAMGDQILFNLAYTLTNNIRSSDMLFRWGGDEFAILAPGTTYTNAAELAEKLRSKIAQQSLNNIGKVSISLGVVEHVAKESDQNFFRRADTALRSAKNRGRNQVVLDAYGNSDNWYTEPEAI